MNILKILYYPYYILRSKTFKYISYVAIEIASVCNYQCTMCGYSGEREKGFMSYGLFCSIIEQLKKFKTDYLSLHVYGEPLLHPKFIDIVTYAIKNRHKIALYTNGSLLNPSLAEYLIRLGVNWFCISFIPDKKIYEKFFKNGDYEQVVGNISDLIKIINKYGNRSYFQIRLMTDKKEEYIAYKNTCLKIFEKSSSVSYNRSAFLPIYGQKMHCKSSDNHEYIYTCEPVYKSINILWNGDVVPCCFDVNGLLVMGNVNENCLAEIWNNKKYINLRQRLAKNKDLTDPCLSCFARYYKEHPFISFLKRKLNKVQKN